MVPKIGVAKRSVGLEEKLGFVVAFVSASPFPSKMGNTLSDTHRRQDGDPPIEAFWEASWVQGGADLDPWP